MKQQLDMFAVREVIESSNININSRKREVVYQRYACYAFIKEYTSYSYERIGRLFSGKDHASIRHGVLEHKKFASVSDELYLAITNDIRNQLIECLEPLELAKPKKMTYYEQRIIECSSYQEFRNLRAEAIIRVNKPQL